MRSTVATLAALAMGLLIACGSNNSDSTPNSNAGKSGASATQVGGGAAGASSQNGGSSGTQGGSTSAQGGRGGSAGAASSMGGSSAGAAAAGASSTCPNGQTSCSGACVDTKSDANHCGSCTQACAAGSVCVNGACGCATGKTLCGTSCVDTTSDANNCGACANACSGGRSCVGSSCQCPTGQAFCGTACVDTMTSTSNCGACGTPCSLGQACVGGACTTGGGALGPDGCQGLAQNLTLSQISVYQSVKIPIMTNGAEVAAGARNADVVVGRDALFRLSVSVGSGWVTRQLSGRVFVNNGGTIDVYSAKVNVSGSSTDATLASTFQVSVPKDKITSSTQYQVEIVECATGSGGVMSPRFPAGNGTALGARQTGGLKIKVIPLSANSMLPDTSATTLQLYENLFLSMYPITTIDMSVGDTVTVADDMDWTGMLDSVRAKRQTDAPAADVYYFGLLKPTATLREYCGSGCTAGIGFVVTQATGSQQASQRAALGLAFGDETSAETMTHEVGHNHGRNHAPCAPQGSTISGIDAAYPYANGAVGVYGWDGRTSTLIVPTRTDIMGYCNNKWISDYTYQGILNRVAAVDGAPMNDELTALDSIHPWRILLVDANGARWGIPVTTPRAPAGVAESAEVLDALGNVITTTQVYRTEISDIDAFSIEVPAPGLGWYGVRVAGAPAIAFAP